MRRWGPITAAAVVAGALAWAAPAPPAGAAEPPASAAAAPTVDWHGFSDMPDDGHTYNASGGVTGSITGPSPSSTVTVTFARSTAAECPHAMSGPGIETVTGPATYLSIAHWFLFGVGFDDLAAGTWVWGTTTVDGVTSEMTECQRVFPTDPQEVTLGDVTATTATVSFVPSLGTTSLQARVLDDDGNPLAIHDVPPTSPVTLTGLTPGTATMVDFVAVNDQAGTGLQSVVTPTFVPPFRSLHDFTAQQFQDFAGRAPTSDEAFASANAVLLGTGADPAPAFSQIDGLVDDPHWGGVQSSVVRLYRAYFLRAPDQSGFTFWIGRRRAGWKLGDISAEFARSSEFRRRYGSLTNRQFVQLLYQNALGRTGDAHGVDYWTARLDARVKSRGQVMLEFSDSNELKAKSAAMVGTVNVFTGMLRRVPSPTELATWAPTGSTPPPRVELIAALFGSAAYDARVDGSVPPAP